MILRNKIRALKKIAWTSGGLCALFCLLPLFGLALGIGSLGVVAFYLESMAFGFLAISIVALLLLRIPKQSERACATDCECQTDASSGLPIACDLNAISNEKRGEHIETAKKLYASFNEAKELPDGYAFRLPPDSDSIIRAVTFIATERLCCPFFTFTLQIKDKGDSVWLSLTGGETVKQYLRDTVLNDEDILNLKANVRLAAAV